VLVFPRAFPVVAAGTGARTRPTPGLHLSAMLERGGAAFLTFGTTAGWSAQVQTSTSLITWTKVGGAFTGDTAPRTATQNVSGQTSRFYRVQHTRTTP
jgi:hypothetical protein